MENTSKKAEYLRIALALQGFGIEKQFAERIIKTYDVIDMKGGDFNIKDAVNIDAEMNKREAKLRIKKRTGK